MQLQDQIENFQKQIFSHFRSAVNNECMISALVPLVTESYGIYKFITSMLRAMHSCVYTTSLNNQFDTDEVQHLVTTRRWSLCVPAMTANITALSNSTTNARTSAILQVSSQYRNFHKSHQMCSRMTTKNAQHCQCDRGRLSLNRERKHHHQEEKQLMRSRSTSFGRMSNGASKMNTNRSKEGFKSNGRLRSVCSNSNPCKHRETLRNSNDYKRNNNALRRSSSCVISTNNKPRAAWENSSGKTLMQERSMSATNLCSSSMIEE